MWSFSGDVRLCFRRMRIDTIGPEWSMPYVLDHPEKDTAQHARSAPISVRDLAAAD